MGGLPVRDGANRAVAARTDDPHGHVVGPAEPERDRLHGLRTRARRRERPHGRHAADRAAVELESLGDRERRRGSDEQAEDQGRREEPLQDLRFYGSAVARTSRYRSSSMLRPVTIRTAGHGRSGSALNAASGAAAAPSTRIPCAAYSATARASSSSETSASRSTARGSSSTAERNA